MTTKPERIIIDRNIAVERVWEKSQGIRDWYTKEISTPFDLNNHGRSEYKTYGLGGIGGYVDDIISSGIEDGIISETEDGEYYFEVR